MIYSHADRCAAQGLRSRSDEGNLQRKEHTGVLVEGVHTQHDAGGLWPKHKLSTCPIIDTGRRAPQRTSDQILPGKRAFLRLWRRIIRAPFERVAQARPKHCKNVRTMWAATPPPRHPPSTASAQNGGEMQKHTENMGTCNCAFSRIFFEHWPSSQFPRRSAIILFNRGSTSSFYFKGFPEGRVVLQGSRVQWEGTEPLVWMVF